MRDDSSSAVINRKPRASSTWRFVRNAGNGLVVGAIVLAR